MIKKTCISIASLAKELKVAPSTISRALNDNPSISPERTKVIKDLARKRNYVPNQMAVNLKSGRRNTIGVIVPLISRSFFATVIEGIENCASANGYDVIICQSKNSVELEEHLVSTIGGKVDGVIASLASQDAPHLYYNTLSVPLVLFDRVDYQIKAASVRLNDFKGAKTATKHLLEQGFRRVFHLSGPRYTSIWNDRHLGYLDAMKDYGIEVPDSWHFQGPTIESKGEQFARQMIESRDGTPEALFCSGDYVALGAIKEFKRNGIDMPIVGFANEPFCQVIEPTLSSVDQFGSQMGQTACQMLVDLIAGKQVENIVIEPELIIRKSSLKRK